MSCPTNQIVTGCDFAQNLVDETPKFDEVIIEDIRPTDGWLFNVATGELPMGTPTEVSQDRFRTSYPNITKSWLRTVANGPGCVGNPCSKIEHKIGWGADRLTYFTEEQSWATDLMCFDQDMHITHAKEHLAQIISKILKPATSWISSNFLRQRHLMWGNYKWQMDAAQSRFTYQWTLGGTNLDENIYFDCSVNPLVIGKMVPQALQRRFDPLMRIGYAGENPFKETAPFIELVTNMDTVWELDHLGGQSGIGGGDSPNVLGNWRFQNFDATTKYWRYGFSGQIGNFMARSDPFGLRFNFVTDLGANANGGNGNRYRYQIVLPYVNSITTGAGGSAGIGDLPNPAYDNAQFTISQIHHKKGMQLLTSTAGSLNPEMPFGHRDFSGKWQFVMDNLGQDSNGVTIENKRRNKGQFIADYKYTIRPMHTEFMEPIFHMREQFNIPVIRPVTPDPGYPPQSYISENGQCPLPTQFQALYGNFPCAVPTGSQDGNVPWPPTPIPSGSWDQ